MNKTAGTCRRHPGPRKPLDQAPHRVHQPRVRVSLAHACYLPLVAHHAPDLQPPGPGQLGEGGVRPGMGGLGLGADPFQTGLVYGWALLLTPVQVFATVLLPRLGFKRLTLAGWGARSWFLLVPLGLSLLLRDRAPAAWMIHAVVAAMFLLMLRIVNSPFGRVLQAIRENDFRAEALGYRTVVYRTLSNVISAAFATLAGCLLALWLRYNGPDTSLSFEIMLDILLIVVIGGMGTLYGAVVGSVLFLLAQSYLQDLLRWLGGLAEGVPLLPALLTPDRWLLWLGLLFVLAVYHFPSGIVGRLRALRRL